MKLLVIYPHQLFIDILKTDYTIILIEHPHFFTRLKFHKQKLMLHRASMKNLYDRIKETNKNIEYIDYKDTNLEEIIKNYISKAEEILFYDPAEKSLLDEIIKLQNNSSIKISLLDSPSFINNRASLIKQFKNKKKLLLYNFYRQERKRLKILVDKDLEPIGGKWSFDKENRDPLPKDFKSPAKPRAKNNKYVKEARLWVEKNFPTNPGYSAKFIWPIDHKSANNELTNFIKKKLQYFGKYQDAVDKDNQFLYHSLLSAALNIGLLQPQEVIDKVIKQKNISISIASKEGFIRQILGWREFMWGVYCTHINNINENELKNNNKLPYSFWTGKTEIEPLDVAIKQLLETAYLHHIYRLMFFGNFMLLTFTDPKDVYKWFSEMFIDAYDWVMIPNVLGMSQYATKVKIVTKPYFSSSKYILKMSNFTKGSWSKKWDELFWNFVAKKKDILKHNFRLRMLIKQYEKKTKS